MPSSDIAFDEKIKSWLAQERFGYYLDIGPGMGKYAKILRNLYAEKVFLKAVEVDSDYIEKFDLNSLYDEIENERVEDFVVNNPSFYTDVAIIGDCLEHLKKSDGIDLIHYLVYRTKWIIIVYPEKYVQYDHEGHRFEAHYSVWSKLDFRYFDYKFFSKKMILNKGIINLVIIKGYLNDINTVNSPIYEKR